MLRGLACNVFEQLGDLQQAPCINNKNKNNNALCKRKGSLRELLSHVSNHELTPSCQQHGMFCVNKMLADPSLLWL